MPSCLTARARFAAPRREADPAAYAGQATGCPDADWLGNTRGNPCADADRAIAGNGARGTPQWGWPGTGCVRRWGCMAQAEGRGVMRRILALLLLGLVVWAAPVAAQKPTPPPTPAPVAPPVVERPGADQTSGHRPQATAYRNARGPARDNARPTATATTVATLAAHGDTRYTSSDPTASHRDAAMTPTAVFMATPTC